MCSQYEVITFYKTLWLSFFCSSLNHGISLIFFFPLFLNKHFYYLAITVMSFIEQSQM